VILTHANGRFEAISSYFEKERCKAAGMRWDPTRKRWWTSDWRIAANLSGCCDQKARAAIGRHQVRTEKTQDASRAVDAEIEVPAPPELSYLPFQKAGIAYALERPNTIVADEMGLGKTVQALGVVNADGSIRSVLVICPASLRLNWKREAKRWLVRPLSVGVALDSFPMTDVVIVNYDRLGKHRAALRSREWDMLVVDECFPYETAVLTDRGSLPIGKIVEERLPVSVLSCDLSQNALQWQPVVGWIEKRSGSPLLKVIHESGEFTCTGNHEIWTEEKGYVRADALQGHHHLRVLRETGDGYAQREEHGPVLQSLLRGEGDECQAGGEGGNLPRINETRNEELRVVSEGLQLSLTGRGAQCEAALLRGQLRGEMADDSSGQGRDVASSDPQGTGQSPRQEGPAIGRTDEAKQSDAQRRESGEGGGGAEGQAIPDYARRERSADETADDARRSVGSPDRARHIDQGPEGRLRRRPVVLQGGPSACVEQDRNRSGRLQPQGAQDPGSGPTQGYGTIRSRVVGVEILEPEGVGGSRRGNGRDQNVYCLEVEGTHNFFADGILVSNCHYLKNAKAQRTREVFGRPKRGDQDRIEPIRAARRLFLSGTPILNRPVELWPILRACGWKDWLQYVKRYCAAYRGRFGWDVSGASNLDELQDRLRTELMVRRLKADVLTELPPKQRQIIEVSANGADRQVQAELNLIRRISPTVAEDGFLEAVSRLQQRDFGAFGELSRLRHETALAKVRAVVEHIADCIESSPKIILFGHHKDALGQIRKGLTNAGITSVLLTGDMGQDDRQRSVDRFQHDPDAQVFCGTIGAAGVGITLTAANHVVFAELDWVPGNMSQAEDRCHRIGQRNSVLVQHLVFEGSLDAMIAQTLVRKQQIIEQALDVPA